jgi:hypothetical protein
VRKNLDFRDAGITVSLPGIVITIRASCKMMIFVQNQGMLKNFTAGI